MAITRRKGKVTKKWVEGCGSEPVFNFLYRNPKLNVLADMLVGWWGASQITNNEGEPNGIFRSYESSPGLWVYDDDELKMTFLVWSDGWKKEPWKGSSIELVMHEGARKEDIATGVERIVKYLIKSSGYYGFQNPGTVKAYGES